MLTSLDPHSSYLSADDAADMRVQTRGEFGGLGIEVTQEEGFVKVVSPMDGTPAADAGIQAGDFITHVDGQSVLGLTLDDAVELMRGPVGSEIVITVVREGVEQPFDVSIIRDTIKVTAVRSRHVGDTVVLRITTFNDQTFPNLEEGMKKEIEALGGMDKVNGFVIDLRNNPGGLLTQAISVSDAFLEKGEIVSTRGRNPQDGERFNANGGRPCRRQADRRADQRRLGLGLGNRRGRAAGPPPRHRHRHQELRQGLGPDRHAARRRRGDAADHGALLHALGPVDPGAGRLARHRRAAARTAPPIRTPPRRTRPPPPSPTAPKATSAARSRTTA